MSVFQGFSTLCAKLREQNTGKKKRARKRTKEGPRMDSEANAEPNEPHNKKEENSFESIDGNERPGCFCLFLWIQVSFCSWFLLIIINKKEKLASGLIESIAIVDLRGMCVFVRGVLEKELEKKGTIAQFMHIFGEEQPKSRDF
jgi:hypothetical protein